MPGGFTPAAPAAPAAPPAAPAAPAAEAKEETWESAPNVVAKEEEAVAPAAQVSMMYVWGLGGCVLRVRACEKLFALLW